MPGGHFADDRGLPQRAHVSGQSDFNAREVRSDQVDFVLRDDGPNRCRLLGGQVPDHLALFQPTPRQISRTGDLSPPLQRSDNHQLGQTIFGMGQFVLRLLMCLGLHRSFYPAPGDGIASVAVGQCGQKAALSTVLGCPRRLHIDGQAVIHQHGHRLAGVKHLPR